MKFNVGNAQHIGAREQQQDSFAFSDPNDLDILGHGGFLGIVADGMGGLSHGQQASAVAVQTFLDAYRSKSSAEPIPDALRRSLLEANRAVMEMQKLNSSSECGTTLAAAVVTEEHLYWVAAGDSRIYWLKNNQLTRLTADHVYATRLDREVALGKLSRESAQQDPQRASLTSYLGQPGPTLIDCNLKPVTLHEDESIIICSDGFYRAATEAEIVAYFTTDPQTACDRLVELVVAKQRRQQDNITVIAFRVRAGERRFSHASTLAKASMLAIVSALLALSATAYWFRDRLTVQHPAAVAAPVPISPPPPADGQVTVSKPSSAALPASSAATAGATAQVAPKGKASQSRIKKPPSRSGVAQPKQQPAPVIGQSPSAMGAKPAMLPPPEKPPAAAVQPAEKPPAVEVPAVPVGPPAAGKPPTPDAPPAQGLPPQSPPPTSSPEPHARLAIEAGQKLVFVSSIPAMTEQCLGGVLPALAEG